MYQRVPKLSIILANLEEVLVISIFHETKIPMIDTKVQVYSKFLKNKIRKKVKHPISMRNGTFNTSKCRGKLQKMGVLYPNFQFFFCKIAKNWESHSLSRPMLRPVGDRWSPARQLVTSGRELVG
jgi:hypothetical protein